VVGRVSKMHRARALPRPEKPLGAEFFEVPSPIADLLPDGGIRRGATVAVHGSNALALAVASGTRGTWRAAVGAPALGVLAAAELGIDVRRLALVQPGGALAWARTVHALLGGCEVVLAWPPASLGLQWAQRLTAIAREQSAVLVVAGARWPGRVDIAIELTRSEWMGLERGAGRLRARRVEIAVSGRGALSLERRGVLWLPDASGRIARIAHEVVVGQEQAAR
jgi:hypothetical protein